MERLCKDIDGLELCARTADEQDKCFLGEEIEERRQTVLKLHGLIAGEVGHRGVVLSDLG
eukprot:1854519-Alexandrium_andersonii.AAC.1